MSVNAMSRRALVTAGAYAWLGTSITFLGARSAKAATRMQAGSNSANEKLIRAYYTGWEKKDWSAVDSFLAVSFTFSSAAGDDHINKSTFKARCWDSQAESIDRFELESVLTNAIGTDAFVKYLCRTRKGTTFRNVEYFEFATSQINAIECYFGGDVGYPSASDSGEKK